MNEQELLKEVQTGNQKAFRQLYDMYYDYAIRVATVVMNNHSANAADAVQETFIRVYRNIHLFELNRPFKPWFYKILINECNRILNKSGKLVSVSEVYQAEKPPLDNNYENLYQAILSLETHNRIPIVLKYLNGFKEQEIADILDVNVNTIKSRLFKGRQKLKLYLETKKEAK